jgi:tRNA1Val (adenine37-N6)-methyltransferase
VLHWQPELQYDLIFSNPPFYENELKSPGDKKNIAHHDEGLKLGKLVQFIENHLSADGTFFLLLPLKRERELEHLLQQYNLHLQQKVYVQQTLKHQPFRLMIQGLRKKISEARTTVLSIKDNDDQYTPEFIALLKDYYLYL